ncbi:hypothetical protein ACIPF8_21090 [Collimonas sp. NPDC087041]|uniref:hypothetical protein n=1 Tax=Collimonas sp. NPDC087041 TaxID=3363960 RepID=UPI0038200454
MSDIGHNRAIKMAAKATLQPIGCKQKGSSRTWLDPHSMWTGVIEFQPSSWAKGSYLNVGACWLWHEKDFLSFDDGYRVAQFQAMGAEDLFTQASVTLATQAHDEVLKLRSRFSSIEKIAAHLKDKDFSNIWQNYHAAVAATLVNDMAHASTRFRAVMQDKDNRSWALELKSHTTILQSISNDSVLFLRTIEEIVERSKKRLKIS